MARSESEALKQPLDDWWFAGEPCEPDNMAWCSRCKPNGYPNVVYMTRGWSGAFHTSPTCRGLADGQRQVEARGGNAAPIEAVNIQAALGSGRFACLVCFRQPTEASRSAPITSNTTTTADSDPVRARPGVQPIRSLLRATARVHVEEASEVKPRLSENLLPRPGEHRGDEPTELPEPLVVFVRKWSRWGFKRLYVTDNHGNALGFIDARGGTVHPRSASEQPVLAKILATLPELPPGKVSHEHSSTGATARTIVLVKVIRARDAVRLEFDRIDDEHQPEWIGSADPGTGFITAHPKDFAVIASAVERFTVLTREHELDAQSS